MSERTPDPQEMAALAALFNGRRLAEAMKLADSLANRFPTHPFGWKVLGAALGQAGQVAQAIPALQKAAALSPEDPEAQNNLGNAQRSIGQLLEAETSYQRAL